MSDFISHRVSHEYVQTNPASPDKVFPLLCPVRETDWLPGWQYQLIYSDSGLAELGCVFNTPNPPSPSGQPAAETTWITTDYDPAAHRISYVWINPGKIIAELRIRLAEAGAGTTHARIRYRYTGLSPAGNRELEAYDRAWFEKRMQKWETSINHYLRTGQRMADSLAG